MSSFTPNTNKPKNKDEDSNSDELTMSPPSPALSANASPASSSSLALEYQTPSPSSTHHYKKKRQHQPLKKKGGRLSYGSPVGPRTPTSPAVQGKIRRLFLIRHGQSKGQRASRSERKSDSRLTDCGLSRAGIEQAQLIPQLLQGVDIQAIVTSPLTRAIHTTLLAFAQDINNNNVPILVGYDLREIGSNIPENRPRKFKDIWRELDVDKATQQRFDLASLRHPSQTHEPWPKASDASLPHVVRKDRVRNVFNQLAHSSHEEEGRVLPLHIDTIAVVCHYNVIRTALSDPHHAQAATHIHPINAQPLECRLHPNGFVEFVRAWDGTEEELEQQDNDNNKDGGGDGDDDDPMDISMEDAQ